MKKKIFVIPALIIAMIAIICACGFTVAAVGNSSDKNYCQSQNCNFVDDNGDGICDNAGNCIHTDCVNSGNCQGTHNGNCNGTGAVNNHHGNGHHGGRR